MNFFVTRKYKKTRKIYKISKSSEQLEELYLNLQERCAFNIKSHKKIQGFTLSLEKVTITVKILSNRKLSKISEFSILGIGQFSEIFFFSS